MSRTLNRIRYGSPSSRFAMPIHIFRQAQTVYALMLRFGPGILLTSANECILSLHLKVRRKTFDAIGNKFQSSFERGRQQLPKS